MRTRDRVSVVSATWNERETLPELTRRIHEALSGVRHEIIIVDDSSPDGTYTLASKLADKAICKRREGQSEGAGLRRGDVWSHHPCERSR
jgi:dolichol-phosphate mannosyltransferase